MESSRKQKSYKFLCPIERQRESVGKEDNPKGDSSFVPVNQY